MRGLPDPPIIVVREGHPPVISGNTQRIRGDLKSCKDVLAGLGSAGCDQLVLNCNHRVAERAQIHFEFAALLDRLSGLKHLADRSVELHQQIVGFPQQAKRLVPALAKFDRVLEYVCKLAAEVEASKDGQNVERRERKINDVDARETY